MQVYFHLTSKRKSIKKVTDLCDTEFKQQQLFGELISLRNSSSLGHSPEKRFMFVFIHLMYYRDFVYNFLKNFAFDFCRFCIVIQFFHPRHNGQWPPTSQDFYTRSYPLHYFLILFLGIIVHVRNHARHFWLPCTLTELSLK